MKIKSAKAKGRTLQNLVRDKLREIFVHTSKMPRLEEDDIKSQTMGMTGEDIVLSPAARKIIPYSFECKNQERVQIWKALTQALGNAGGRVPVVVIKRNHTEPYAILDLNSFIDLIKDGNGP